MNLDSLTDEQLMLRDTLRKMLTAQSPIKLVRQMETDPTGHPAALWKSLAEMGITGLNLAEEFGGSAMGSIETALVYEELGRALCPVPHLETSVISAGIISMAGSAEQKQQWLPKIAAGEVVLTPAFLEPESSYSANGIHLKAVVGTNGYCLNGRKFFVSFAAAADRLLTLVRSGPGAAGVDILLVDPKAKGVTLTKTATHALDARYQVDFDNVLVPLSDRIGGKGIGWQTWNTVGLDVMIAQAAWFVGCGDKDLELANAYAKERVQFDRPIGSFMAIAHQLADSLTGIVGARYMTWQAAWAKDTGRPHARLAAMAHLQSAEAGRFATRTGQQIFGGIGFTNDIDVQLYLRRAKQNMFAWFDAKHLEELVASDLIDGEGK